MRNRQNSDPIRSGRIRVRSAAAVRYRFYVRSVLVAAAAICVAAGAIVVDRASHPIRRAVFQCWHEANPTQPDNTETMCAWIEYRSEPMNGSGDHGTYPIRSQCLTSDPIRAKLAA